MHPLAVLSVLFSTAALSSAVAIPDDSSSQLQNLLSSEQQVPFSPNSDIRPQVEKQTLRQLISTFDGSNLDDGSIGGKKIGKGGRRGCRREDPVKQLRRLVLESEQGKQFLKLHQESVEIDDTSLRASVEKDHISLLTSLLDPFSSKRLGSVSLDEQEDYELWRDMALELIRISDTTKGSWVSFFGDVNVNGDEKGEQSLVWLSEMDKMRLKSGMRVVSRDGVSLAGKGWVDEDGWMKLNKGGKWRFDDPPEPTYPSLSDDSNAKLIKEINSGLDSSVMRSNLETLSSFWNRNFRSTNGQKSSEWVMERVQEVIASYYESPTISSSNPPYQLSAHFFNHSSWPQSSIVARIVPSFEIQSRSRNSHSHSPSYGKPQPKSNPKPYLIVGAHQDSLNYAFPYGRAPGADDDGSGSVTILETFRNLIQHLTESDGAKEGKWSPDREVQFHWYSAEEGGLLGSGEVARWLVLGDDERKTREGLEDLKEKEVGAMVQFDMTAYVTTNTTPAITLIQSDTTPGLTNWSMAVSEKHADSEVRGGLLQPRAGSDHMSYHRLSIPSTFFVEGDPFSSETTPPGKYPTRVTGFDPYIHTPKDDIQLPEENEDGTRKELDFEHAKRFAKSAVAWVVELSTKEW